MSCLSEEYIISVCVHGVPEIDSIMETIIKTLGGGGGGGSFPVEQAKAVVAAIARYGIDSTTGEHKKSHIIESVCKPLCEALLGSEERVSCGASLCLKALVEIDNWGFASVEMVNEVCENVGIALEDQDQDKDKSSKSHMELVMALAKHNPLVVEAYATWLIQSGLHILKTSVLKEKRLSAIQMVNFLIKTLDPRSFSSHVVALIIQEMDNCQSDQMAYISGAAFEALLTAKRLSFDRGSKFDKTPDLKFARRGHRHLTPESESQTQTETVASSFMEYDSTNSLLISDNTDHPKSWSYENGVSLTDLALNNETGLYNNAQDFWDFSIFWPFGII